MISYILQNTLREIPKYSTLSELVGWYPNSELKFGFGACLVKTQIDQS
jgi:hypothetical protein